MVGKICFGEEFCLGVVLLSQPSSISVDGGRGGGAK